MLRSRFNRNAQPVVKRVPCCAEKTASCGTSAEAVSINKPVGAYHMLLVNILMALAAIVTILEFVMHVSDRIAARKRRKKGGAGQ